MNMTAENEAMLSQISCSEASFTKGRDILA